MLDGLTSFPGDREDLLHAIQVLRHRLALLLQRAHLALQPVRLPGQLCVLGCCEPGDGQDGHILQSVWCCCSGLLQDSMFRW